jgi:CO/xanthine dehydrogenase FAD-binding subunit
VIRTAKAEAIVKQGGLTDEAIEAAAVSVLKEVSPIDDHRASAGYRRAMCGVVARRLLRELQGEQRKSRSS